MFEDYLFRYRFFDNEGKNLDAFLNDKLYYSVPNHFNDPYDNMISINIDNLRNEIISSLNANMDDYLKQSDFGIIGNQIARSAWICSDKTVGRFIEKAEEYAKELQYKLKENMKIICFSEVFDSILMWSHYADCHKGFCLGYKKENIIKAKSYDSKDNAIQLKTDLLKVEYKNRMPSASSDFIRDYIHSESNPLIDDITKDYQKLLREFIVTKCSEWNYEKEWRLVPRTLNVKEQSPFIYLHIKPDVVMISTESFKKGRQLEVLLSRCINDNIPVYLNDIDIQSGDFLIESSICEKEVLQSILQVKNLNLFKYD